MSARDLIVAKKAVMDLLKIKQDTHRGLLRVNPDGGLERVRIDYAYNPRLAEVEYVWGGGARLVGERLVDAAGGRELTISLELFVDVRAAGEELEAADERGAQIAEVVEAILAADPQLGGAVPGLVFQSLAAAEIEYGYYDDDSATSSLRVDVQLQLHTRRS